MNFTREPIIETIMSPREGYKLVVRNSRGAGQEEYFVDALEIVSFGNALFFRSTERLKPFLVPVSDYEVVEVRETRMVLKNAAVERSIKIGGGKEVAKLPKEDKTVEVVAKTKEATPELKTDKKGLRRRHSRRRKTTREDTAEESTTQENEAQEKEDESKVSIENNIKDTEEVIAKGIQRGGGNHDESKVSSSVLSLLFPPPSTLISEKISQSKNTTFSQGTVLPQPVIVAESSLQKESSDPETPSESVSSLPSSIESTSFPVSGENVREILTVEEKKTMDDNLIESSSMIGAIAESTPEVPADEVINGVDPS